MKSVSGLIIVIKLIVLTVVVLIASRKNSRWSFIFEGVKNDQMSKLIYMCNFMLIRIVVAFLVGISD